MALQCNKWVFNSTSSVYFTSLLQKELTRWFHVRRIVEERSWQRAKVALRPTSSSLEIWLVKPSCLWSSWREKDRGREWDGCVFKCVCLCELYFSAWSGLLTSPFLWHWLHTNFIISSSSSSWPQHFLFIAQDPCSRSSTKMYFDTSGFVNHIVNPWLMETQYEQREFRDDHHSLWNVCSHISDPHKLHRYMTMNQNSTLWLRNFISEWNNDCSMCNCRNSFLL